MQGYLGSKDMQSLGLGVVLQSIWVLGYVGSKWYVGFVSLGRKENMTSPFSMRCVFMQRGYREQLKLVFFWLVVEMSIP